MEDPPEPILALLSTILLAGMPTLGLILGLAVLVSLLVCSALISGAEVAFFSLSKSQLDEMESSEARRDSSLCESSPMTDLRLPK